MRGWAHGTAPGAAWLAGARLQAKLLGLVLAGAIVLLAASASTQTQAAVVSSGPILVLPNPGFGPADPTGCDPGSDATLAFANSAPFQQPDAPVIVTDAAKLSGLPGVVDGGVSFGGGVTVAPQSANGSPVDPAFDGPIIATDVTIFLSAQDGAQDVFYDLVLGDLRPPPPGATTGLNRASCYGWDQGDVDPATSSAIVRADLRAGFSGTRTGPGGATAVAGEVTITVSRRCAMVTARNGVCSGGASIVFEPGAPPSCLPPPAGVIGWWRGELDTTAEVGPDLSGLTAYNWGARVGLGFAFGQGTRLEATGLPEVSDGLTVEAWVSPVMFEGTGSTIMSRWDFPSTDDAARSYWLRMEPYPIGKLVFETDDTTARRPQVLAAVVPELVGSGIRHVAATWSPTSIDLYVDGTRVASAPSQGGRLNGAVSTPFQVGNHVRGGWFGYAGLIDEPTVYDRALSAAEIQAIVDTGAAGKCPS